MHRWSATLSSLKRAKFPGTIFWFRILTDPERWNWVIPLTSLASWRNRKKTNLLNLKLWDHTIFEDNSNLNNHLLFNLTWSMMKNKQDRRFWFAQTIQMRLWLTTIKLMHRKMSIESHLWRANWPAGRLVSNHRLLLSQRINQLHHRSLL